MCYLLSQALTEQIVRVTQHWYTVGPNQLVSIGGIHTDRIKPVAQELLQPYGLDAVHITLQSVQNVFKTKRAVFL